MLGVQGQYTGDHSARTQGKVIAQLLFSLLPHPNLPEGEGCLLATQIGSIQYSLDK